MKTHAKIVSLWDMYNFHASKLIGVSTAMAILRDHFASMPADKAQRPIKDDEVTRLQPTFEALKLFLNEMEMQVSIVLLEKIEYALGTRSSLSDISLAMTIFQSGVEAELKSKVFLGITAKEAGYWEPQSPLFGADVDQKFTRASYDIEEAGKCLALGRSTAAVFHLMRVIESGLRAVAICIGLSPTFAGQGKSWGTILGEIKTAKETKGKSWAEKALFEEICTMLWGIKSAWRDTTMHVENTYTEAEAEHLFVLVKGFMQKIASRMDESGLPLA